MLKNCRQPLIDAKIWPHPSLKTAVILSVGPGNRNQQGPASSLSKKRWEGRARGRNCNRPQSRGAFLMAHRFTIQGVHEMGARTSSSWCVCLRAPRAFCFNSAARGIDGRIMRLSTNVRISWRQIKMINRVLNYECGMTDWAVFCNMASINFLQRHPKWSAQNTSCLLPELGTFGIFFFINKK